MIGEDECELARQTLGQQIAASQVSGVISNRTEVELEYGQLYHLNRKLMRGQMDLNPVDSASRFCQKVRDSLSVRGLLGPMTRCRDFTTSFLSSFAAM